MADRRKSDLLRIAGLHPEAQHRKVFQAELLCPFVEYWVLQRGTVKQSPAGIAQGFAPLVEGSFDQVEKCFFAFSV